MWEEKHKRETLYAVLGFYPVIDFAVFPTLTLLFESGDLNRNEHIEAALMVGGWLKRMKAIWFSHIIFLMKAHALNLILSQSAPVLIKSVKFQRFFQLMMSTEDHLSLQNYWSSLDGTRGKQFNNKPFVLFGFPFSFASKCFLSVLHSQIKWILLSVFSLEPEKHQ